MNNVIEKLLDTKKEIEWEIAWRKKDYSNLKDLPKLEYALAYVNKLIEIMRG